VPLIASSATFALSSALYRFRCWVMNTPYNFLDTAILSYGPVQLLGDIIILHTDQDIIFAHVCQIIRGKDIVQT